MIDGAEWSVAHDVRLTDDGVEHVAGVDGEQCAAAAVASTQAATECGASAAAVKVHNASAHDTCHESAAACSVRSVGVGRQRCWAVADVPRDGNQPVNDNGKSGRRAYACASQRTAVERVLTNKAADCCETAAVANGAVFWPTSPRGVLLRLGRGQRHVIAQELEHGAELAPFDAAGTRGRHYCADADQRVATRVGACIAPAVWCCCRWQCSLWAGGAPEPDRRCDCSTRVRAGRRRR